MKKSLVILKGFLIMSVFLIFSFISADFETGDPDYSIEKQYAPNDSIKGWINISLNNEPADFLFVDSFNNSISLINLLKLNNNLNYTCFPNDCQNDYSENNAETTKTFDLNTGDIKIIGLKFIGGNFEGVSTFSMNISSTVGESTSPQFYIDILNDNQIEWVPYTPSNNFYSEKYGCYRNPPSETVLIYNQQYCEKINIPIAPNVEIGGYVIEDEEGMGEVINFNFNICDTKYQECGSCQASTSGSGRISCVADFEIDKKQDFFVCMSTQNSVDNFKYKINSETDNPCGYSESEENERDFEIFAKPGKYAEPGEFRLDENEIRDSGNFIDVEFYIEDYIERYNNECSNGCIVPIKFISGETNQVITISDINVFYTISGTPKQISEVYDLTEISPKINSGFQKLYLDNANFFVFGNFDTNIEYSLNFNNEQIFLENILIKKIPKIISLNTQKVIAAYPTNFVVKTEILDSSANITKYDWDFGDGTNSTTSEDKITHTYNSIGTFELKLTITDSNFLTSSKIFDITVDTPKEAVNSVLKNKLGNLEKVNSQIENLPIFHKNSLNSVLNLDEIEGELSSLQQRNLTAITDDDYVSIMKDLIKINVPESVFETKSASSVGFYPNENKINLEILKEIGGGDYDINEKSKYIDSIVLWNFENINAEITNKEFSASYKDSAEFILNIFELEIKENRAEKDSFLIIPKLDNLEFRENYGKQEKSEYFYIELIRGENKKIEFSTTENIDFSDLPVFISPRIWELSVTDKKILEEEKRLSQQTLIILIILLIIFIGLVAYIILQEWYKRKYENYLFKNKNSLYNIISYIENAKKKGIKAKEISQKLKEAGWNSEQVRYVMKKYAGERTGMFEIPLEKILNLFSKKEKIIVAKRKFPKKDINS